MESNNQESNNLPQTNSVEVSIPTNLSENDKEEVIDEEMIAIVIKEAKCTREQAIKALKENEMDPVYAALSILTKF